MLSEFRTMTDEVALVAAPATVEEFEKFGYWAANPDVAQGSPSSRDHFKPIGQAQGRAEASYADHIKRLQDCKPTKSIYLLGPSVERRLGEPLNFRSSEPLDEFEVADTSPVSAHPYPDTVINLVYDNPDEQFLDVAAGLRPTYYGNVVNTEMYPSLSTGVLCVGEAMPFVNEQFDFVFCLATSEYPRRRWNGAREIGRVLKSGGTAMIDYRFLQPEHGYPHHDFNATALGCRSLREQACDISSVEVAWHHPTMIGLQEC
jgi:SAM-dependent methyltransferase